MSDKHGKFVNKNGNGDSTDLDAVYSALDSDQKRALYDRWAPDYDRQIIEDHGYDGHLEAATLLAQLLIPGDSPLIDFGCGSGLAGAALAEAGFTAITGIDLSG